MITLSQTAGNDKDLILIVRINLDTEYMYFSDTENQITLSSIVFDGKVISKNSISEATKDVDVTSGGTIGQVGNWNLSLARYTTYTGSITTFNDFFNDFAPATSKPLLTSKTVDVGVVWAGATTTSEITWLYQFYIEDYDWTTYSLNLGCIEYDELVATQLPYYTIQKEKNNGISYFTNAPDESYGQIIPIVYGDFGLLSLEYSTSRLVPTLRVHKDNFQYIISSHINHTVSGTANLWKYIESASNMMTLTGVTPASSNTRAGFYVSLNTDGSIIKGSLIIQPRLFLQDGAGWDYPTGASSYPFANAYDDDSATYCQITNNSEISYELSRKLSLSDVGVLSGANTTDVRFIALFDVPSGTATVNIKYLHRDLGYSPLVSTGNYSGNNNAPSYNIGYGAGINSQFDVYPRKWVEGLPWTIEEVNELEFHIICTGGVTIFLKNCYVELNNIIVSQSYEFIPYSIPFSVNDIAMTDMKLPSNIQKMKKPFSYLNNDNIFCYVKGYIYDGWID